MFIIIEDRTNEREIIKKWKEDNQDMAKNFTHEFRVLDKDNNIFAFGKSIHKNIEPLHIIHFYFPVIKKLQYKEDFTLGNTEHKSFEI